MLTAQKPQAIVVSISFDSISVVSISCISDFSDTCVIFVSSSNVSGISDFSDTCVIYSEDEETAYINSLLKKLKEKYNNMYINDNGYFEYIDDNGVVHTYDPYDPENTYLYSRIMCSFYILLCIVVADNGSNVGISSVTHSDKGKINACFFCLLPVDIALISCRKYVTDL